MKRLMILTDSIGAPRVFPTTCRYEETWPYLIKKEVESKKLDVVVITDNGLDSNKLLKEIESKYKLFDSSVILFQYGIVDCAPRVFTEKEKLFFRLLHLHQIAAIIGKRYHASLSNLRNSSHIEIEKFERNVQQINQVLKSNLDCLIINIPIAEPCQGYLEISPRIKEKIDKYNNVLKQYSDLYLKEITTSFKRYKEYIYMSDHHHLNAEGHYLVYKLLLPILKNKLTEIKD